LASIFFETFEILLRSIKKMLILEKKSSFIETSKSLKFSAFIDFSRNTKLKANGIKKRNEISYRRSNGD